jgi:NADPH-dependent 2,4-dienoyl-CoA reductase/sulfur reductase-like enzyme
VADTDPLVVVGAGAGGLTVVEALRRQGYDAPIVLVGAESHLPYDRPPLSKGFLLGSLERGRLTLREADVLDELEVELLLGRNALELDLEGRRVRLDDGRVLSYAHLVLATGIRPHYPDFADAERVVHTLRTLEDAERLADAMRTASTAIVVGGGLLGYEVAASACTAGLRTTLIDPARIPLAGLLGPMAGAAVAELHRENGVDLRLGRRALGATARFPRPGAEVALDDGSTLAADLVIAAVGSRPNTEWLAGSGLDLADGIGCDRHGRAAPGVYAVGDVARWRRPGGARERLEHRMNATEQGVAVARHIVHGIEPGPICPYFWTDQYSQRIQVAGQVPPDAETSVVAGDLASRRFVMTATRNGATTGVLGWQMAKDFARHRADVARAY